MNLSGITVSWVDCELWKWLNYVSLGISTCSQCFSWICCFFSRALLPCCIVAAYVTVTSHFACFLCFGNSFISQELMYFSAFSWRPVSVDCSREVADIAGVSLRMQLSAWSTRSAYFRFGKRSIYHSLVFGLCPDHHSKRAQSARNYLAEQLGEDVCLFMFTFWDGE